MTRVYCPLSRRTPTWLRIAINAKRCRRTRGRLRGSKCRHRRAVQETDYLVETLAAIANLVGPPRETIVVLDKAPPAALGAARCIASEPLGPAQKRDMGTAGTGGELLGKL